MYIIFRGRTIVLQLSAARNEWLQSWAFTSPTPRMRVRWWARRQWHSPHNTRWPFSQAECRKPAMWPGKGQVCQRGSVCLYRCMAPPGRCCQSWGKWSRQSRSLQRLFLEKHTHKCTPLKVLCGRESCLQNDYGLLSRLFSSQANSKVCAEERCRAPSRFCVFINLLFSS